MDLVSLITAVLTLFNDSTIWYTICNKKVNARGDKQPGTPGKKCQEE